MSAVDPVMRASRPLAPRPQHSARLPLDWPPDSVVPVTVATSHVWSVPALMLITLLVVLKLVAVTACGVL